MIASDTREIVARYHNGDAQTPFQFDHFVLRGDHVTEWGQFRACVRELDARIKIIADIDHRYSGIRGWFRSRLARRRDAEVKRRAEVEANHLENRLHEMRKSLEGHHGQLTPETCAKLEAVEYRERLVAMAEAERMERATGISSGTIRAITNLGRDVERDVMHRLGFRDVADGNQIAPQVPSDGGGGQC